MTSSGQMVVVLVDQGLIGLFTRVWLSPRVMANWIWWNWQVLIKGKLTNYFYGRGFYAFLFQTKDDGDLIFIYEPYIFFTH